MLSRPLVPVLAIVAALAAALLTTPCAAAPQYRNNPPARGKTPPKPPAEETPPAKSDRMDKGEARFYDKLDPADREALQANVGWLMPAPSGHLEWIGGDALTPDDFRDQVTVIQVVNSKSGGRGTLEKLRKNLPEEVRLLGLHTPENATRAQTVFGTNPPCLIAVDLSGHWCDALGVWKRPVSIVIDKTGAVRYVGLNDAGLKAKLPLLLEEVVDESVQAKRRPEAKPMETAEQAPATWPTFNNQVQGARDARGQKFPGFVVQSWWSATPDPAGRLVAVDFWATSCGPCRAAIPHINELNGRFYQDVLFVGVSSESRAEFKQGLERYNLRDNNFTYPLALDPQARMARFLDLRGIPHMAIFSPDGIVRWQGHPAELTADDLTKLTAAHRALSATPSSDGNQRSWVSVTGGKPVDR